ncbi:hypothetical protein AGLY_017229 [Aphis glycines]|uniref:Uncharacterized protein n=1 Tax=Aphis glycines TaxID=307491 RepID=A0A6G0SW65_APHGL|nr:hypothetical protein AGLY_017229 [Aphis glycines]
MARASLPEFAGKKEEDPERFLLQAEATLEKTGIRIARWVTVLAPQLKAQAGTWWRTMRALNFPWKEFKFEFIEDLQSELLSTAQTKAKTLEGYVFYKYQLYRGLNLGLTEEAIHAHIEQLKSFNELHVLAHILDDSKAIVSDKAGESTSGPPKLKWLDRKKLSMLANPRCLIKGNDCLPGQDVECVVVMTTDKRHVQKGSRSRETPKRPTGPPGPGRPGSNRRKNKESSEESVCD